ncbi:MAG: hypothetical protein HPM95_05830 [Alphaproteobacteria bacterium]|nr:hypothetical protein [Alphaproteobacteria bacterium]
MGQVVEAGPDSGFSAGETVFVLGPIATRAHAACSARRRQRSFCPEPAPFALPMRSARMQCSCRLRRPRITPSPFATRHRRS